jgi:hypothetical protein
MVEKTNAVYSENCLMAMELDFSRRTQEGLTWALSGQGCKRVGFGSLQVNVSIQTLHAECDVSPIVIVFFHSRCSNRLKSNYQRCCEEIPA